MPPENESMMVLVIEGIAHDVRYYNDDTGFGETACGKPVVPCDTTISGKFDCKNCLEKS